MQANINKRMLQRLLILAVVICFLLGSNIFRVFYLSKLQIKDVDLMRSGMFRVVWPETRIWICTVKAAYA